MASIIFGASAGLNILTRRIGQPVHNNQRAGPYAVDVYCKANTAVAGSSTTTGSDWVQMDWANQTKGDYPTVKKAVSIGAAGAVLGIVVEESGSVAAAGFCWVRIYGYHANAKLDGTTDVSKGDGLIYEGSTGGAAKKGTPASDAGHWGWAAEAYTTNSIAGKDVFLANPSGIVVA